jgi:NAD(P)H dehydrogenase (quinone)
VTENKHTSNCCKILLSIMSRAGSASKSGAMAAKPTSTNKVLINVIYYSMYGHIATMAKSIKKGAEAAGAEVRLIQVPETLSQEVLAKMHAPEKDKTVPTLTFGPAGENTVTVEDALTNCDGIIFGYPTRFGGMPAQVKAVWDSTGGLWIKGALIGKPISVFFSTGSQGGGQETTVLTSLTNFIHHGMLYVPIGYSSPLLGNMNEIHGGSAYGIGTFAGADGSRQPSQLELQLAEHQGSHFTQTATALKIGRAALPPKEASPPDPKQGEGQTKAERPPSVKK